MLSERWNGTGWSILSTPSPRSGGKFRASFRSIVPVAHNLHCCRVRADSLRLFDGGGKAQRHYMDCSAHPQPGGQGLHRTRGGRLRIHDQLHRRGKRRRGRLFLRFSASRQTSLRTGSWLHRTHGTCLDETDAGDERLGSVGDRARVHGNEPSPQRHSYPGRVDRCDPQRGHLGVTFFDTAQVYGPFTNEQLVEGRLARS